MRNGHHDDGKRRGMGSIAYPIAPARPRRLVSMRDAIETVR
jgi:hypothetical protein